MSIRKALGAVKDQTRIGIAKVAVSGTAALDVAIVRATAHDDAPADDRHAREVLRLTSSPSSRARVSACVAAVSRRLARTRDYVVAAKCLALLHRLLADGDPHFRHELSGHGAVAAVAAEFRDEAHPASWDHTAFVRALALYLDARARFLLSLLPPPRTVRFASLEHPSSSPAPDMAARPAHEMDAGALLARAGQLRHLIERCLACQPAGGARRSRVVLAALWPVVKDSAALYADMAAVLAVLLDRFFDMEDYDDCAEAFEAHVSAARLADGLRDLYAWCDHAGVARSSDLDFPEVKRVDDKFLETLEQLLRERGQAEAAQTPSPPPANAHAMNGIEHDVNGIRALPAPEHYKAAATEAAAAEATPMRDDQIQKQSDLVDLRESAEEQGNKMALALFSGTPPPATETETKSCGWVAFDDDAPITTSSWQTPAGEPGWELALVETASTMSSRSTAAPGGGMDALLLHGMYDHGAAVRQQQQHAASGSASSVALPGAASAGFLALPGPAHGGDPFAASLAVPPPAYVQMAEMERKRELLAQEQRMWAQYRQGGMQGQTGLNGVAVGGGGSAFAASSSMPMAMPMGAYHGGYYHY